MKKILLLFTFLFSILFIVSCFGTFASFTRTSNVYYEPLNEDAFIKVFVQKVPKKGIYQEIGLITVRGNSLEFRYEQARIKAREVGANALISISEKERIEYHRIYSTDVTKRHSHSRTNYHNSHNNTHHNYQYYGDNQRHNNNQYSNQYGHRSRSRTDTYYTTRSENIPVQVTEQSFLAIAVQKPQISDSDLVEQRDFFSRR